MNATRQYYLHIDNFVQSYILRYYNIQYLYSKYSFEWAYQDSAPLCLIYPTFIFGDETYPKLL